MAKRDEQRRINTRPEGSAQAVGTLITPTQVVGGLPNTIGGWVFGPASLGNSGIVLHSGGWIQVGVDDYTVRLDAMDTAYRMWAGAPLGVDAPFSITVDGSLHAENAYIEGEIVADTGAIGGFVIGADHIRDVADSMGLASVVTAGDDVRFWAGDTFANRAIAPFRVTEAGLLTAQGATIEGALTATTGELVNLDVSGLLNLVAGGIIKSDNFATGVSGWQVKHDGVAEFQDALIRGVLDTVVFRQNTISTVAGTLRVEPTPTTTEVTVQLTVPAVSGTTGMTVKGGFSPIYAVNDQVTLVDPLLQQQGTLVVAAVLVSGEAELEYLVRNDGDANPTDVFVVGSLVYKVTTDPGYLLITANPVLGGPRYAVVDSSGGVDTLVGVLGNLEGSFGVITKKYGIGVGDYVNGNYLLYEPTNGFVMRAGDGAVSVDAAGMRLRLVDGTAFDAKKAVSFVEADGDIGASLWAFQYTSGGNPIRTAASLGVNPLAGLESMLWLGSAAPTGYRGAMEITARSGSGTTPAGYIKMYGDDTEAAGAQSQVNIGAQAINLVGEGLIPSPDAALNVYGTIRESVPIHMRLSQRTTTQSIPSGAWTYRYLNTVEYANTGSGIAGADLRWMHTPVVFTGTGLNDLTHLGQATYPESGTTQFQVKITGVGTPDSFQYSVDNGATWNGTNIAITGASQTIGGARNVRIQFAATTGHALNDLWDWDELPRHMIVANKAGLYQIVAAASFGITAGTTLPYRIQTAIRKNGTLYQVEQEVIQAQSEQSVGISVSGLVWLNVGDWVDCPLYQNSGVSKDIGAATDALQSWNAVTIARVA